MVMCCGLGKLLIVTYAVCNSSRRQTEMMTGEEQNTLLQYAF